MITDHGETDGQTEGQLTIAIPRFACGASRGKNYSTSKQYVYVMAVRVFVDLF